MKKKTAIIYIRDGVLVDRMYINPVAFAFASWMNAKPEYQKSPFFLEELINFGFAKSGVSAAQKMKLFNEEKASEIIEDIESASAVYDKLATKAAEKAEFFDGAVELLGDLREVGVLNFITSAVNQDILDEWRANDTKGKIISPYLEEILGTRSPEFMKGKAHFDYIVNKYGVNKIYYVADAESEIKTGKLFADSHNIIPVGFGHTITVANVMKGVELVRSAIRELYGNKISLEISPEKISLQNAEEIRLALKKAGAQKVVASDGQNGIMRALRKYFADANFIPGEEA